MTTPVPTLEAPDPMTVTIGTREFLVSRGTTAEQDYHLMSLFGKAGLDSFFQTFATTDEKNHAKMGYLMTIKAYQAGVLFELLGACLTEANKGPWTQQMARDTATYFASLTDKDAKSQMNELLVQVLVGFFVNGRDLAEIFQSYSVVPMNEVAG